MSSETRMVKSTSKIQGNTPPVSLATENSFEKYKLCRYEQIKLIFCTNKYSYFVSAEGIDSEGDEVKQGLSCI